MKRTLVVVRHAKSDWGVPVGDDERPLAPRGRRQAPEVGRWIARHLGLPDLAVVSTAARARQTWDLASAELPGPSPIRTEPRAYTFSGHDLLELVAGFPADARSIVLVGHNPAAEELVESLTGQGVVMPTASVAVIELSAWTARSGRLLALGRPADGTLALLPGRD